MIINGQEDAVRSQNSAKSDLSRLLSRGGQRAPIDNFIFAVRYPAQFAALPDKERLPIEAKNAALRDRFSREILALIVDLQEQILTAHGSRRSFLSLLEEKPGNGHVNATILSRVLGGHYTNGPRKHPWLPAVVARHCARVGTSSDDLCLRFARLWQAAYGEVPKELAHVAAAEAFTPAGADEISLILDPAVAATGHRGSPSGLAAGPLADSIPDAVLFTDFHGRIQRSNSAARRLWGADDGLLGRSLLELLPAFDISRLPHFADGHNLPSTNKHPLRMDTRTHDGNDRLVEVHSVRLDTDGQQRSGSKAPPGQLMVLVKDLTSLHKMEVELVRQQRQTELILHTAAEGILRIGADATISMANAAAASLLGYKPTELIGQHLPSLAHSVRPDGTSQAFAESLLGRSLASAKPCTVRGQGLKAHDGTALQTDLHATPAVEGDKGSEFVVTFTLRREKDRPRQLSPSQPEVDQARAAASRLKDQVAEYHQLVIQILARMDDADAVVVSDLCGGLTPAARNNLLNSSKIARAAFAVPTPAISLGTTRRMSPPATLSAIVDRSVRQASQGTSRTTPRFVVFAPPTAADVDADWLTGILTRLLHAATFGTSAPRPVIVAAALRSQSIRVDIRADLLHLAPSHLAQLEADARTYGATLSFFDNRKNTDESILSLELPTEHKPHPGDSAPAQQGQGTTPPAQPDESAPRPPPPRATNQTRTAPQRQRASATQAHRSTAINGTDAERTPSPSGPAVELTTNGYLLTVNPATGSEVQRLPPGKQPARPAKYTPAERTALAESRTLPTLAGPPPHQLPLLARQDERERALRLLARGHSVRLIGPAGSGRTSLLDAIAHDCADLAPDGVIRLNGHHRSANDLLHALFHTVYKAPRHRPGHPEIRAYVRDIGAIVVLDDLEFGGSALDHLLDAAPECAFAMTATPDVPASSAAEAVYLTSLERSHGLAIIERTLGRTLTEEETNWAVGSFVETEGHPLRLVQHGALLRQRDQRQAADAELDTSAASALSPHPRNARMPLPSLAEAAAPAPLLASGLSKSARSTVRFAIALSGEVPHPAHLPALTGDTHADAALGELLSCGLVTPVGSRYRLATTIASQLKNAGYGDDSTTRALTATEHYAWWAAHPKVSPERVCAEADALLAALANAATTSTPARGEESPAVRLARAASPALAQSLEWSLWNQLLQAGIAAAQFTGSVSEQAYFHHEFGILALCRAQFIRAGAEFETSLRLLGRTDARAARVTQSALSLANAPTDSTQWGEPAPPGEPVDDTTSGTQKVEPGAQAQQQTFSAKIKKFWSK
ncbi:PAS domain S-box protein [Streptomyces sp. NPDC005385]|uniref:PAS domain S-box protein n=1 Tax=Streptomyces sp. NPDC005385 TaxID=3157039 RepID=UPI0033B9C31A